MFIIFYILVAAIAHLHVYPPVQELLQKLHSKAAPEHVPAQLDHTDGVNFIRLEIAAKLMSAIPVMGDTGYPGIERARNIDLGKDIYIYIYIYILFMCDSVLKF